MTNDDVRLRAAAFYPAKEEAMPIINNIRPLFHGIIKQTRQSFSNALSSTSTLESLLSTPIYPVITRLLKTLAQNGSHSHRNVHVQEAAVHCQA